MIRRLISVMTVACVAACAHATAFGPSIVDDFSGPTNLWQVTSGLLDRGDGVGQTSSPVFRMNSVERDFNDVTVSVTMAVDSIGSGEDWNGAHVWVRYQSEYELYVASVDREDGTMIIKKKCAGGPDPSNGGTYYDLTDFQPAGPVPYGHWQHVSVHAADNSDGSVTITAQRDGHFLSGTDHGVGCAPLHGGGVGVRSDNTSLRLAYIAVD